MSMKAHMKSSQHGIQHSSIPYLFFEQDKIIIGMNTAYYAYTHPIGIVPSSDTSSNIAQEGKANSYITTVFILLSHCKSIVR